MPIIIRNSILALIVLVFSISLTFGFKQVTEIDETLESRLAENAVWGGAQLQFELGRFRESLFQHLSSKDDTSVRDVLKRFDILWSRMQIFRNGDLAELVAASDKKSLVDNIQKLLEEIDSVIIDEDFKTEPKRTTVDKILATSGRINSLSQELTAAIMHAEQVRVVSYIRARQAAIHDILIPLAGLLFCGAAFTVSLIISNRHAQRATATAISSEEAEIAARERLTDAIESMTKGFAVIDGAGRYVSANTIFRSHMNRFSGDMPSDQYFETALKAGFKHNILLDPLGRPVERIIDALRRADGTGFEFIMDDETWVEVSTHRTMSGTTIVTISDVTTRKRWEIETENARDTAIRNMEAQSSFLSMMSHEIRTPLNGVLGILQVIVDEPLAQSARHYVKTALQSAMALRTVIDDVLDASKIEANELVLHQKPLSLAELSENVLDLMTPAANEQGLTMTLTLDPRLPKSVSGDADRLRQVLNNFTSNAIKFTPRGSVGISLELVKRSGHCCVVRFAVSDSGIGVPAEKQEDLFRPFKQIDASYSRRFGGTGLGLAISKTLAEKMGGNVGFDSTVGEGSRFWFDIPFEVVHGTTWAGDIKAGKARDIRISLSDPALRQSLYRQIKDLGFEVSIGPDQGGSAVAIDSNTILINDQCAVSAANSGPGRHLVILHSENMVEEMTDKLDPGTRFLRYPVHPRTLVRELCDTPTPSKVETEDTAPVLRHQGGRHWRVLIADDSKTNQLVMEAFLKDLTSEITITEDGKQAVEAVRKDAYDLVLMDISMPVMDGLEATRQIRKFSNLPILGVTAHAFGSALAMCREAGMDGVLTKPVAKKEFTATIEDLLAKRSQTLSLAATGTSPC